MDDQDKKINHHYYLKLDHSNSSHQIDQFLNQWKLIPDFTNAGLGDVTDADLITAIESDDVELVTEVLTGERTSKIIQRQGQTAIRQIILKSYNHKCALCDVDEDDMLIASHIVPWSKDKNIRGVLHNVICLCRLHDYLFESGRLTIMDDYSVKFSKSFLQKCKPRGSYQAYKLATSSRLTLPLFKSPLPELLRKHRDSFISVHYDTI